jgi:cyclophilin family peptidyl-prolyl cis-trans isomerase
MVFQLYQSTTVEGKTVPLAANTVARITQFTNDDYYTTPTNGNASATKLFNRIISLTGAGSDVIAQGGGPDATDTAGQSGQPNTPFPNENFQQLALTGTDQIAMANAGLTAAGTNDTQFFITTSNLNSVLGYNYTIFGQMVSGQTILANMVNPSIVPTNFSGVPDNNVSITAVSLTSTNPNGVVIIDTTQAKPGETATFRVVATDPADGSSVSRSFTVTVGPYGGPIDPSIDFRPFANPTTASVPDGRATTVTLAGQSGYPDASLPATLTYTLISQPSHGTISHFNAATGAFVYTPDPGFTGTDSFHYQVQEFGPATQFFGAVGPATTTISNPGAVTITVTPKIRTTAPLVTLTRVRYAMNQEREVTQIFLTFSGALNDTAADDTTTYHLATPGKNGSFTGKHAGTISLASASYNGQKTVTLVPTAPFALSTKVEVVVYGEGPSALEDSLGRLIDGKHNGKPGGNAVAILTKRG